MLSSLISYLRAALPTMRQSGSTLARELELARSFLTILKMRMGERLNFTIEADPALDDAQVPPMVLPTLVENAIKHGLSPLPEGGRIDIVARRDGDDLLIDVRDNGAGFSSTGGSGVGLANTRSRLTVLYGPRAALSLLAAEPRGVVASVRMPLCRRDAVQHGARPPALPGAGTGSPVSAVDQRVTTRCVRGLGAGPAQPPTWTCSRPRARCWSPFTTSRSSPTSSAARESDTSSCSTCSARSCCSSSPCSPGPRRPRPCVHRTARNRALALAIVISGVLASSSSFRCCTPSPSGRSGRK